jgi:hypothetical protein
MPAALASLMSKLDSLHPRANSTVPSGRTSESRVLGGSSSVRKKPPSSAMSPRPTDSCSPNTSPTAWTTAGARWKSPAVPNSTPNPKGAANEQAAKTTVNAATAIPAGIRISSSLPSRRHLCAGAAPRC